MSIVSTEKRNSWEVEAGGTEIQGYHWLHRVLGWPELHLKEKGEGATGTSPGDERTTGEREGEFPSGSTGSGVVKG